MCTCLIAGRRASRSGYALLAANDDWDDTPALLTHVPRQKHAPDAVYTLVGGHTIPEIGETCGYLYTACKYEIGTLDRAWAGGTNDRNVSVAGPSGLDSCQSGATFSIADPSEGWVLEITPGGYWVAVRVPDDEVSVRANAFGTHDADLTDKANVLASEGLADYARAQGWWDGDERHFDFAGAYGADKSPNEWGPELDSMNMRRRWRAMELLSGKPQDENETLYSVRPAEPITRRTLMDVLSDVYDGTKYDLTKLPSGDPFADVTPDYALCRRGTLSSIVADYTPETGSVLWTAIATPRMSFYMPLYVDIDGLPAFCEAFLPGEGENTSLFWEFKELCILTQRRFARHMEITGKAKREWEAHAAAVLAAHSRDMAQLPESERRAARTKFDRAVLTSALETCRETRHALLLQY